MPPSTRNGAEAVVCATSARGVDYTLVDVARSLVDGLRAAGVGRLHCLPWDADTGLKWAELLARLRTTGKAMPIKDSLIAATAAVHGLAVVTRNRADFVNAGVRIVDPFVG